jgi:UDPglucose--hexose-1-phosphate uridylyltransferase
MPGDADLVVYENDHFVAFVPFAPPSEYCVWILPREHVADLFLAPNERAGRAGASRRTLLAALADVLRTVCRKLYWLCGNPDYSTIMRTPPIDQTDALLTEAYHWHLEVSPKFTKTGGLELATQMNVLLTEPTQAAKKNCVSLTRTRAVDGEDRALCIRSANSRAPEGILGHPRQGA